MAALVIYAAVGCGLAMWASYWLTASFGPSQTRASRIAIFVSAPLAALLLAISVKPVFGAFGIDPENGPLASGRGAEGVIFIFAVLILIPTVLISVSTATFFKAKSQR